jgi:hypothetical protein
MAFEAVKLPILTLLPSSGRGMRQCQGSPCTDTKRGFHISLEMIEAERWRILHFTRISPTRSSLLFLILILILFVFWPGLLWLRGAERTRKRAQAMESDQDQEYDPPSALMLRRTGQDQDNTDPRSKWSWSPKDPCKEQPHRSTPRAFAPRPLGGYRTFILREKGARATDQRWTRGNPSLLNRSCFRRQKFTHVSILNIASRAALSLARGPGKRQAGGLAHSPRGLSGFAF